MAGQARLARAFLLVASVAAGLQSLATASEDDREGQRLLREFDCHTIHEAFEPEPGFDCPSKEQLPSEMREDLLNTLSEWALQTGYLPCPYEMFATFTLDSDGRLVAHIGAWESKNILAAAAYVVIDPDTRSILDAGRVHSPCVNHGD